MKADKIPKPKVKEEKKVEKPRRYITSQIFSNGLAEIVYRNDKIHFCIWDSNAKDWTYKDQLEEPVMKYRPYPVQVMVKAQQMFLPTEPEEYGDTLKLADEIYQYLYKWIDYPDEYRKLDVWYVFLTWVYDLFPTIPYRRALGGWGEGKTRWATALGSICRLAYMQGATTTPAAVFRLSDKIKGTMIIDENYFSTKTDVGQAIINILNSGYSKATGFVVRCNSDTFQPRGYVSYGPKLVAARRSFPDEATESRTITHHSYETRREDINLTKKIHLIPEFWEESLHLRNKLLLWRFRNFSNGIEYDEDFLKQKMSPRLKEIMLPLASVMKDPKTRGNFMQLAVSLDKRLEADRGLTREAEVLQAIFELKIEGKTLSMGNISKQVQEGNPDLVIFSPRKCGWFVRKVLCLDARQMWDKETKTTPVTIEQTSENMNRLKRLISQHVPGDTITSLTSLTTLTKGVGDTDDHD